MSDPRVQPGPPNQGQPDQPKVSVPMEKPLVERMKAQLQGRGQDSQILDPANPNLRQS